MSSIDLVDRRVFAAVRLLDAVTGAPVSGAFTVSSDEVELRSNRSGLIVITALKTPSLTGLMSEAERVEFVTSRGYSLQTDTGAAPPSSLPFTLLVTDRSGRYLERRCALRIVARLLTDPLAAPVPFDREMMLSSVMQPWPGNVVIRASVSLAGVPLPGVLFNVRRASGNEILARGMSDTNGEALILVPRIPVSTWVDSDADGLVDAGEVTTTTTSVRLIAAYDPANWNPATRTLINVPEPDVLQATAGLPRRTITFSVASGGTYRQVIAF